MTCPRCLRVLVPWNLPRRADRCAPPDWRNCIRRPADVVRVHGAANVLPPAKGSRDDFRRTLEGITRELTRLGGLRDTLAGMARVAVDRRMRRLRRVRIETWKRLVAVTPRERGDDGNSQEESQ